MLAGLGVGLGFKAGLFNIGATGSTSSAPSRRSRPLTRADTDPIIAIPFAVIVGAIGGALWGFIPGVLKAFCGAHEVVTTIMLNYVAYLLVSWLISGPLRQPRSPQPVTPDVGNAALPMLFGRDGHLGILLAFIAVPIVWFLLYRMTIGFQIRAVGANPDASRYAGMKPRRLIILDDERRRPARRPGRHDRHPRHRAHHEADVHHECRLRRDHRRAARPLESGRHHARGALVRCLACGRARDADPAGVPADLVTCSRRSSCSSWSSARSCVASSVCEE